MFRGFGVLLNKYERNIWLEYNKLDKESKFKVKSNEVNTLLGIKTINNKM